MSLTPDQLNNKRYYGVFAEMPDICHDTEFTVLPVETAHAWMDAAAQILAMSGVAFPGDWLASLTNYEGTTVETVAADKEHEDWREGTLADFFVNAEDKVAARAKIKYLGEVMFRYARLNNRKVVNA